MRIIAITILIMVFSCNDENPKDKIIDRQRVVKFQIDSLNEAYTYWIDVEQPKMPSDIAARRIFIDTSAASKRFIDSTEKIFLMLREKQKEFDSLEFELKKY